MTLLHLHVMKCKFVSLSITTLLKKRGGGGVEKKIKKKVTQKYVVKRWKKGVQMRNTLLVLPGLIEVVSSIIDRLGTKKSNKHVFA